MTILFLHGWQSIPGGVKPTFLASHGHTVLNPKLPDEDFEQALQIAQEEFIRPVPGARWLLGSDGGWHEATWCRLLEVRNWSRIVACVWGMTEKLPAITHLQAE